MIDGHPARPDRACGPPRAVRWVFPGTLVTPLEGQRVIGKDGGCDTVLAGNEVSRRHAELRGDGAQAGVRDLQSRNGVFVNGVRRAQAPLAAGDVIRCGEWIGVAAVAGGSADGFREIVPGWFGGATLAAAVEPARRVDVPQVTVEGEDGTGKLSFARALREWRLSRGLHPREPADTRPTESPTVVLPPLRARREDITPLFLELLRRHCGGPPPTLEPKLVEALCLHDWPANVRELSQVARRLLALQGHEPVLRKSFLPDEIRERAPSVGGEP